MQSLNSLSLSLLHAIDRVEPRRAERESAKDNLSAHAQNEPIRNAEKVRAFVLAVLWMAYFMRKAS